MTREELTYKVLHSDKSSYVFQLPTGYGKTKLALEKVNQWTTNTSKVLIVIPRLVNVEEWKREIRKWKFYDLLPHITFTTYVSFPKHCSKVWDTIIFDEGHHTSTRCREAMHNLQYNHILVLSATLKGEHLDFFRIKCNPCLISLDVRDAINSNVLPDPKVILLPLTLDNSRMNHVIEKNITRRTNPAKILTIPFSDKWKYRSYKGPLRISCTQLQYYNDLSNLIEWYKQKAATSVRMHNMWLNKAGVRLKWLAAQKEYLIKSLLKTLKDYRVLAFCQSIEQSEKLGCPCVNSKIGTFNLERFNSKRIKHIASIDMLNEGLNPIDCKIGLFQMINSSKRITVQRIGRILRHKEPVLIFPYWVNTREEEIIEKLIENYNQNLISIVSSTDNIKDYV